MADSVRGTLSCLWMYVSDYRGTLCGRQAGQFDDTISVAEGNRRILPRFSIFEGDRSDYRVCADCIARVEAIGTLPAFLHTTSSQKSQP